MKLENILGAKINGRTVSEMKYGGTVVWPLTIEYTLGNVRVVYSEGSNLYASASNYAILVATLRATRGSSYTDTDVYITPNSSSVYYTQDSSYRLRANKDRFGTTEYYNASVRHSFSGTYTINGRTITPTFGNTSVYVNLQDNTSSTYREAYDSPLRLESSLSTSSLPSYGGSTTVSSTYYYTHYDTEYVWTSGMHSGGNSTPRQSYVTPTVTCYGASSISGNVVTLPANSLTSDKYYTIYAYYGDFRNELSCTVVAESYYFTELSVSNFAYDTIPARSGDVKPYFNIYQEKKRGSDNVVVATISGIINKTGVTSINITGSDGVSYTYSIAYYVDATSSVNGNVHADSLGKNTTSSATLIKSNCYVVVSGNSKQKTSSTTNVYQEINARNTTYDSGWYDYGQPSIIGIDIEPNSYYADLTVNNYTSSSSPAPSEGATTTLSVIAYHNQKNQWRQIQKRDYHYKWTSDAEDDFQDSRNYDYWDANYSRKDDSITPEVEVGARDWISISDTTVTINSNTGASRQGVISVNNNGYRDSETVYQARYVADIVMTVSIHGPRIPEGQLFEWYPITVTAGIDNTYSSDMSIDINGIFVTHQDQSTNTITDGHTGTITITAGNNSAQLSIEPSRLKRYGFVIGDKVKAICGTKPDVVSRLVITETTVNKGDI